MRRRRIAPVLSALLLGLTCTAASAATARIAHVFVALADNAHQGIVPVPAFLGDGDRPAQNLYWGAAYGVKTYFGRKAPAWQLEGCREKPSAAILERCVFSSRGELRAYVVADAYRGREIGAAMQDFMRSAAGKLPLRETVKDRNGQDLALEAPQGAVLSVYVGHNGLMDAPLHPLAGTFPGGTPRQGRQAAVLACKSQAYFSSSLERSGAQSLVLTHDFMAPEAYVVEAVIDGWRRGQRAEQTRIDAARAYAMYQKISEKAARRVFGAPKPAGG